MMTKPFFYNSAHDLCIEDVCLLDIASKVKTPVYVYSQKTIIDSFKAYRQAFKAPLWSIHYAVKANGHRSILELVHACGAGCDVVSQGEIIRALDAGINAQDIIFSGVGKTEAELLFALNHHIGRFNIESETEIDFLAALAEKTGHKPQLSIRVNPDIDADTHHKISTGRKGDKFGIAFDDVAALYRRAYKNPSLRMSGLGVHIGSQITNLEPFDAAFARLAGLAADLQNEGMALTHIDIGGGRAIAYQEGMPIPSLEDYAKLAEKYFTPLNVQLALEPGRSLIGEAGILMAQIICIKMDDILVIDAGMNDFMRPALYDAKHMIWPLRKPALRQEKKILYDVVGPVCETTDIFARKYALTSLSRGDYLIIADTGAYGAVMASEYNARARIAEVMVKGALWAEITPRGDLEAFKQQEKKLTWKIDA